MRKGDSAALMLAFRAWLDEDDGNARRLAEHVIKRAMAGRFGYFRFLLDAVDGPIRPTAEYEMSLEPDYVLVVADDGREAGTAVAA